MELQERWNQLNHNLGTLKVGETTTATFEYKGDLVIQSWRTSCGCTAVNKINNVFHVSYTAKPVPENLLAVGSTSYQTQQNLFVMYTNGEQDKLFINVKVTQ